MSISRKDEGQRGLRLNSHDECKGKPSRGSKETAELLPAGRKNLTTEIRIYDRSALLSKLPISSKVTVFIAETYTQESGRYILSRIISVAK